MSVVSDGDHLVVSESGPGTEEKMRDEPPKMHPPSIGEAQLPIRVIERSGHVWLVCIGSHDGFTSCNNRIRLANDSDVLNGQAIAEMVRHNRR